MLLRATVTIRRDLPRARLIIAGDGPDRARIQRLIGALSLGESVTMSGHVAHPALDTILGTAWVQAVPSRSPEPSANVIPEAMMRGTAVVTTNRGGAPATVCDGVTGFLVPAHDAGLWRAGWPRRSAIERWPSAWERPDARLPSPS